MQEDWLIMSRKERKRKAILDEVLRGRLRLTDAMGKLGVGYRQAKRILSSYRREGSSGLVHGNRGKTSGHRLEESFKEHVLSHYREHYLGFGPTFASEKLLERDGLEVHRETLRLWLLEAKLWKRQRKRKTYRKQREARRCFGELLQIDGSDHPWFGKANPRCCLLNIVDDATSKTLSRLAGGETSRVLLETFRSWIERYGVPQAVYVDLKNIYISPGRKKDGELVKIYNAFERVCLLLDIEIIPAYSAQAKGRVERNHGIYQDRFVKELYLRGIEEIESANQYLENEYLENINARFAKEPASRKDAHCSAQAYGDLDQIFCWSNERQVKQDWTVQYENQHYQLEKAPGANLKPGGKVEIRRHLDERLSLWKGSRRLEWKVIAARPTSKVEKKPLLEKMSKQEAGKRGAMNSPWGQFNPGWLQTERIEGRPHRQQ